VGGKEGRRCTTYGLQVGIQCQQDASRQAYGSASDGARPHPVEWQLYVGPTGQARPGRTAWAGEPSGNWNSTRLTSRQRYQLAKPSEAAAVSIHWAASNGVAFDHGKTEVAIFHRKKATPTATVKVGDNTVPFSKEATRWLGIWLDSQLRLKDHHAIQLKDGKKAMARLLQLAGQMGLSPTNCRKVVTACIQSVAVFGSELWWKGDHVRGTIGQANQLQLLVNQEARATTGCFRTTNIGALSMESGFRAATAQLENRQRRFGLRMLSLPQRNQAREVVGAPAAIGRRLTNALAYAERTENTVL